MVASWEPLVASILTSIIIGVGGCVIICKGTIRPRKTHLMNVFNQHFFALLFTASFVRCFLWVVWVNPGTPNDNIKQTLAVPIGVRAFILTYPTINLLICSFLIQYPWLYDHILILNTRAINLVLRQQMKTFVVAFNIFTLLIYIIFAFTVPTDTDEENSRLSELYTVIMILEIVAMILVFC